MIKDYLTVFLASMVPIVELRGAIPLGVALGLRLRYTAMAAVIGNLVPVPFIMHFIKAIFSWLRPKHKRLDALITKYETKANVKGGLVEKYGYLGLLVLTAIPLPGTGAWTAALVAAIMELETKKSFVAIAIGVVFAGVVVTFMTAGVREVI